MEQKNILKSSPSESKNAQEIESLAFTEKLKSDGIALELKGRKGPEPTRYGDWEKKGKCVDF